MGCDSSLGMIDGDFGRFCHALRSKRDIAWKEFVRLVRCIT
jgi:hypothetical protein